MESHEIYVYPRISGGVIEKEFENNPKIHQVDAPVIEISATHIRNSIKEGKNIRPLLPNKVWEYLDEMNFYK